MQYLAAYTLASLSGKQPSKDQVSAILNATGQPVDEAQVTAVVNSLKGKNLTDLISKGSSKIGSGSGSAKPAQKIEKKENKKDNKKAKEPEPEPPKEDEEEDFNMNLFD